MATTTEGRIFAVTTAGADITGFDPAHDKLDFGGVSVHNFIVVDTPTGVGFMDPWSGETIVVQGVSLGQLTINSFTPIQNDHLRQCLSGALAWEQGITKAPNTVYARSHELGQIDKVAFNPATDVVDFRFYGSREQIYLNDSAEGLVISNAGTGQALILLGVTKAQLTVNNFVFYAAEVREDRVHLQLGFPIVPDAQVLAQGVPVAGTTAWPTGVGTGAPPAGQAGETFTIAWLYGVNTVLDFDPATDTLDFGWFKAAEIALTEVNGSTVISVEGNKQTYTLTGVSLGSLAMSNISARDPGLRAEWQATLDAAPAPLTVSVSDAQAMEGDAGTTNLVFTVTLSKAATGPVSVSYSTLNGSARAGEDFAATVGTVTFAKGETVKTFAIPVLADKVRELTETMTVQLSAASGAKILDGTGIGTITDNDPDPTPGVPPTISISDYITDEGNADLTHMRIVLTLSKASTETITVRYASADVTATGGVDYEILNGTVTFAPGETTQTIHAHINGDTLVEATETYRILLSDPTNATIADGIGIVTITNDDVAPLPSLSIADASITEGNAGTKLMNLTVTLSQPATGAVTVGYSTANGTATAGADYTAKTGTLSFAAGETTKTIQVSITGDTAFEANETFAVNLTGASGATIARGAATATILNDDVAPLPSLSIADASITEGNAGTKLMNLTVTLSQPATGAVTVGYSTANGTATAGADYTAKTGTLSFAAGETAKTIQVSITGDTLVEADETFAVNLTGASGATIARGMATASITNDDVAASAGALKYSVTSDWNSGFVATVTVAAGSGALNGWRAEFIAPFTITNIWNADIVSHVGDRYVIQNKSYNGAVAAGGETSFGFQASGGASNAISALSLNGGAVATTPVLTITDASVLEGASGAKALAFTVSLSGPSSSPVSVTYATADGTATAGSDYTALAGTLTFAAGETAKTVSVAVLGDTLVEANETFLLNLSKPSGATIGDGVGVGTILNDDVAVSLPALSVGNASILEGASGIANLAFTVSLSAAGTTPVTVAYATANGTALAGSDYTAASGTLTFAAGETAKTVTVAVRGDTAIEADETLTLGLSGATGATIKTATGTGTILNDDLPSISISDASVQEGDTAAGPGWLSTAGNQIVDAAGKTVQIAGVNWFGFEGTNMSPNGLWTRGYKEMMQQMVDEGFNTIRLPYSNDMLHATGQALGIDYSQNADLRGLTPLQVMDRILAYAEQIGIKVILDHHRSDAGAGTSGNGLWYDAAHTEAQWVADWQMLASRYAGNTAVIGADLHNEPYNGTWGGGGANDWAAAAERAGNAIGDVNPNWLIFVEGVATYQGQSYWWGGNLMGVRDRPVTLDVANKLVYSAHDYPNSIYAQPWFQGADFAAKLPQKFDQMWGYIYKENIAPVYIGEFGTKLTDPKDVAWFEAITSYLSGDFDNNGTNDLAAGKQGISWTYWSWNPNSGDTGGILADDWRTVNENKMVYLRPIEFDLPAQGSGGAAAHASFEVTLSAPATSIVTVDYATASGTASAADFTAATGTISFAVGETSKIIKIAILGDTVDEANEGFSVILSNPVRATITDGSGAGTIIDDDPATAGGGRILLGTALADVLAGGTGADTLTGGAGADRFVFTPGGTAIDRITDFNTLDGGAYEGDLLVIKAAAVGAFAYRGASAFTGGSDNSEARVANGQVLIDVNGDGTADITVALTGLTSATQLSAQDFVFG